MNNKGYQSKQYAYSLKEWGEPIHLPAMNGWVLKQPGVVTNLYPFFSCRNPINHSCSWNDIEFLKRDKSIKDLVLYTDPLLNTNSFVPYSYSLADGFLYKQFSKIEKNQPHYIVDFSKELVFSHNHWDNIRTFAKSGYEVNQRTLNFINRYDYADHFYELYQNTIKRNNIEGIAKFSRESFRRQLEVPGLVIFEVLDKKTKLPIAIRTFYLQNNDLYFHLAAASPKAYHISANHALVYEAINWCRQMGIDKLLLGTGPTEGLKSFKLGFANSEIINWRLEAKLNE